MKSTSQKNLFRILALLLSIIIPIAHSDSDDTLTVHETAIKYDCSTTPLNQPRKLSSITKGDKLTKYLLLPLTTNTKDQLCTLTRVDSSETFAGIKTYTPMSRSYTGYDWDLVQGRYIQDVSISCGIVVEGEYTGQYLCQVEVPALEVHNDGYFLTLFEEPKASSRKRAARHLERAQFGTKWDQIVALEEEIEKKGTDAIAQWMHEQVNMQPTSHRKYFRERLNPRAVESYVYGTPGQKACEQNARFRRFAFTYKDAELSRGSSSTAGNTGLPYTPLTVETVGEYTVIKFGDDVRTVLDQPLQYLKGRDPEDLQDGHYTICNAEETIGKRLGDMEYDWSFQVYVDFRDGSGKSDLCTSSFTNRGGVADDKGDGAYDAENKKIAGEQVRTYDSRACTEKCSDKDRVRYITIGNPVVNIPVGYDTSSLSWLDLSSEPADVLTNINVPITHDSDWVLNKNLDTCIDENGDAIPDLAGMSNTDYRSFGRGKYNLDKSVFIKMPGNDNKWALHDPRTIFHKNTMDDPMMDGGGAEMKRAARRGLYDMVDADPETDYIVTRCSNVQRNMVNEPHCKISYDADACVSVPLADPNQDYTVFTLDPGAGNPEPLYKFSPDYAGPNNGGVVMCGSENEVAPDPMEDDTYDVMNRKVQSNRINYADQKRGVWAEVVMTANDQLCQKNGWVLHKIFATSTNMNADNGNSETNIGVLDLFVKNCFSTYRNVMFQSSLLEEMSEQLTYNGNKAVHADWHQNKILANPDENMARENLQLHSIGLTKMKSNGVAILDPQGNLIDNYEQSTIFEFAKIWTGFTSSTRRANNEEQDWSSNSRMDPLVNDKVRMSDWGSKMDLHGGYIGDTYPLCVDLPKKHFLKKHAKYRLLGGSTLPLQHNDPPRYDGDPEVSRMFLDPDSELYSKLCKPKNPQLPPSSLVDGSGEAVYEDKYKAPYCAGSNPTCNSQSLLRPGSDKNNVNTNTIDGCSVRGANTNTAAYNENVGKIVVTSTKGLDLRGGEPVKILASITAFSTCDRVDYYFTSNATTPDWKFITTVAPPAGTTNNLETTYKESPEIQYVLPPCHSNGGCQQAVRVVLRSGRDESNPDKPKCQGRKDYNNKPDSPCPEGKFDDMDDLVFDVHPSQRPQDLCDFQTIVTLDDNLNCTDIECRVDTARVVEVVKGVFYEYMHVPCVFLSVYEDPVKVLAGFNGGGSLNNAAMCANKLWPSAMSTCCGRGDYNPVRDPQSKNRDYADVLIAYRFERLTYEGNSKRCEAWGRRAECDFERIGTFTGVSGQCLNHQGCTEVYGGKTRLETYNYHWTNFPCSIEVKVITNGMVAFIHNPTHKFPLFGTTEYVDTQVHVNASETVSYAFVPWGTNNVEVGKLAYPHFTDNVCDGGVILDDDACLCNTTLEETPVFTSTPSRNEVLSLCKVGAIEPAIYGDEVYMLSSKSSDDVLVYAKNETDSFATDTIFRVVDDNSNIHYRKNVYSLVRVCNGAFSFRNPVSFFDIVDPEVLSKEYEFDALMDHVNSHPNTPPSTCIKLLKYHGFSNPTPHHIEACCKAYISGKFTYTSETNTSEKLTFGGGQLGDLSAALASIYLDRDALSTAAALDPNTGGVNSPLHKFMRFITGMELTRLPHHKRTDGLFTDEWQEVMGEAPYGCPNQFSFYNLNYLPAGRHRLADLPAPEAELLTMNYMVSTQNSYYSLIGDGLSACNGGIGPAVSRGTYNACGNEDGKLTNTAAYLAHKPPANIDLSDAPAVVAHLNTLLTADRLNPSNSAMIESAYSDSYNAAGGGPEEALKVAIILVVSTAEFHTNNAVALTDLPREPTPPDEKNEDEDYKVNLFGGMDSWSMLTPHPDGCPDLYNEYKRERGNSLYLKENELEKIEATNQPCSIFGVNKRLKAFADFYKSGEGIFLANIGHLNKPVNRHNFLTETKTQLFSHETMRDESFKVDAFNVHDHTGVLGRMNDVLRNAGMAIANICIDKDLNIVFGDPEQASNIDIVSRRGTDKFYQSNMFGSVESRSQKLIPIMQGMNSVAQDISSLHADLWSQRFIDTQTRTEIYREILENVEESPDLVNLNTRLGDQLDVVYRLIKAANTNGNRPINRDVFAVQMNGFDQHFSQKPTLNSLFDELNDAVSAFRKAMKRAGLWEKGVMIIHSEFARTIMPNGGGGTDHAWGGNHYMLGGALNGTRVLGDYIDTYDSLSLYMTGRGVSIPTTPNEAPWFGIAQWFGIKEGSIFPDSDKAMKYALPNLENFGCGLFSEKDLFKNGIGTLSACGGDKVNVVQTFLVGEPRMLIAQEQRDFCSVVRNHMQTDNSITTRCVILNMVISTPDVDPVEYWNLNVHYTIITDATGVEEQMLDTVNTEKFIEDAEAVLLMPAKINTAAEETKSPSASPTFPEGAPTPAPKPSTPLPTKSPSQTPTQGPTIVGAGDYLGYDYVGRGLCVPFQNPIELHSYNHLLLEPATGPEECLSLCAKYYWDADLAEGYRGFEYTNAQCRCLFDKNVELDGIISSEDTSAEGQITNVEPADNPTTCYKKAVTVNTPEDVDGYEYFGFGACMNGAFQRFSDTKEPLTDVTDLSSCGQGCTLLDDDVIGFWMQEDNTCHCLLVSDTTPPPTISSSPSQNPTAAPTKPVTTSQPTTKPNQPTTAQPTTAQPTTAQPTTVNPTTNNPTTRRVNPTTNNPTTSSPTTNKPTSSPVLEAILETEIELEVVGITSINDSVIRVIEKVCTVFLGEFAPSSISNVVCAVTSPGARRLEHASSYARRRVRNARILQGDRVIVSVKISGKVQTGLFDDMVLETFDEYRVKFVEKLKTEGLKEAPSVFQTILDVIINRNDNGGNDPPESKSSKHPKYGKQTNSSHKSASTQTTDDTSSSAKSDKSDKAKSGKNKLTTADIQANPVDSSNVTTTGVEYMIKRGRKKRRKFIYSGKTIRRALETNPITKTDFTKGYCYRIVSQGSSVTTEEVERHRIRAHTPTHPDEFLVDG